MNTENESLLFGNREERLNRALKSFEKTKADLEQDIDILKEWIKSQHHLPEVPCDDLLRNIILMNKFSIEKCKQHIDFYYTLRAVIPEIFAERNFRRPQIQAASRMFCYVPFPKLTEEGYRVSLSKLEEGNTDDFNVYHGVTYIQNFLEVRMLADVMMGEIFVCDMSSFTFTHISKITPVHLKKIFTAVEKVYKNVVKQIHFINVSAVVENLISLIKQIVSKKLSERIFAHSSMDSLQKYLPKDILPKEYGGADFTIPELKEKWESVIEKYESRLIELETLRTDESKRPTPLVNDDVLGFYGNFKKLNVD